MVLEERDMTFSYAAIALGALGMVIALLVVYAGPFSPQPDIGTTIGDIAGNMREAAQRALQGVPQPPETIVKPSWDIDRILMIAAPVCGVLGLVASLAAIIRKEPKRAAFAGMGISIGAIVIQVVLIVAIIIAGAIMLVGIMQNMDSILG